MSTLRWTPEQLAAHTARIGKAVAAAPTPVGSVAKPARARKYGNKPTTDAEGVKHASKKQAARYRDLGLLMKSGEILMLAREVRFRLPGGVEYRADHVTATPRAIEVMASLVESGDLVVEDVKSPATRNDKLYKVKAKQMRECLGLEVREI